MPGSPEDCSRSRVVLVCLMRLDHLHTVHSEDLSSPAVAPQGTANSIISTDSQNASARLLSRTVLSLLGCLHIKQFLADRTNGRAIGTVLRPSSVTLCIVAKRCVLEQKLLLRAYRKSYMRNRLVPKCMTLTFA